MSAILRAAHIHHSYDGRPVLRDVGLAVDPGHRVGLVGENGVGKSTLLRILAGVEEPDDGDRTRPADLGYLHQEFPYPPDTLVGAVVEDALAEVRALEADLEAAAAALADPAPSRNKLNGSETCPSEFAESTGGYVSLPAGMSREAAYDRALARAEQADVWDADVRAARTLAGLGLDLAVPGPGGRAANLGGRATGPGAHDTTGLAGRAVGTLSGGQRTRLGLAALLIRQPGALLLDEPTNHLDDDAAEFLARALAALPGAVVLASHDRVFLDEVCTEILDLDPVVELVGGGRADGALGAASDLGTGATLYGGTYSDYLAAKRVERENWERRFAAEQDELAGLRRSVATTARQVAHDRKPKDSFKATYDLHGGRVQTQVSRRVRNAQQRLDTLEQGQVRKPPRQLRFTPPGGGAGAGARSVGAGGAGAGTRRGGTGRGGGAGETFTASAGRGGTATGGLVLWARDVVVPGRLALAGSVEVAPGSRLLITGPNGCGKSTLLHVLAGDFEPAAGTVGMARGVRVGLLEQDVYLSDDARTARAVLALAQGTAPDAGVATHGLVAPKDLDRPLTDLSVGQRRRVVLAMLVTQGPDVLLLDEPTNHISLALAEELMAAIDDWPGAVVVASHDRWLRRGWSGDVYELAGP